MRRFLSFFTAAILSFCFFVFMPFVVHSQSGYISEYPISGNFVIREGYFKNIPHPKMSSSFSEQQQRFLLSSFGRLNSMMGVEQNSLESCLKRYVNRELTASKSPYSDVSSKGLWENWNFTKRLDYFTFQPPMRVIRVVGVLRVPIYVDKFSDENQTLAEAPVGIDWLLEGFRIKINEVALNRSINNPQEFGDYEKWSGTILHEIMHNMGFDHAVLSDDPSDEEFRQKVVGNIVYEAGWCVARSGNEKAPGSFMLTGNSSSSGFYVDSGRPRTGNRPIPSNPERDNPVTVQPGSGRPQCTGSNAFCGGGIDFGSSGRGDFGDDTQCSMVDSRTGWQSVVVPQGYYRIASISGGWSVDASNHAPVGAEGHTGAAGEALAPFSQYKFVNWAHFGALILEDDSQIAAVNVGSEVIPPSGSRTVKFRINDKDEALSDNQGSLQVCFGLGRNRGF